MPKTLDQVVAAFDNWRATRSKRGEIPNELIIQALELVDRYKQTDILKGLCINSTMLNRWIEKHSAEDAFVALPSPAIKATPFSNKNPLEVSIKFSGGTELTLVGTHVDAADFVSELQHRGVL